MIAVDRYVRSFLKGISSGFKVALWGVSLAMMLWHPARCCQRLDADQEHSKDWPRVEAKAYGRP